MGQCPGRKMLEYGGRVVVNDRLQGSPRLGGSDLGKGHQHLSALNDIGRPGDQAGQKGLRSRCIGHVPQTDNRSHARLRFGMTKRMDQTVGIRGIAQIPDHVGTAVRTKSNVRRHFHETTWAEENGHTISDGLGHHDSRTCRLISSSPTLHVQKPTPRLMERNKRYYFGLLRFSEIFSSFATLIKIVPLGVCGNRGMVCSGNLPVRSFRNATISFTCLLDSDLPN